MIDKDPIDDELPYITHRDLDNFSRFLLDIFMGYMNETKKPNTSQQLRVTDTGLRFGGVSKTPSPEVKAESEQFYISVHHPFIELYSYEDEIYVLMDLGVDEDDIFFDVGESEISLKYVVDSNMHSNHIELPENVDVSSVNVTYRNGIMELILKRSIKE